jgi:hypothetical protein
MDKDGIDYTPRNINIANICMNPSRSVKYLVDEAYRHKDSQVHWQRESDLATTNYFRRFAARTAVQYQARASALQQAAYARSLEAGDDKKEED